MTIEHSRREGGHPMTDIITRLLSMSEAMYMDRREIGGNGQKRDRTRRVRKGATPCKIG